ncbi:cobalamin biosynthesis protein [Phormidium sp. FACHB-592]|uniref:Cobalamin biosynthesis protein n=1 Tax=Stenomitos frigidus AS-A4 TaxID=2933935 RepID=A0ABV0KNU2_9CYAN|nr:cobalamin biosynthesis protein [Phormidium sp. FACHB-592]MBD2077385.1 cobalamin biosynthesis protein [Phormidium sp. FACHB-592]
MVAAKGQTIQCPPRKLWVGIGCKRGTSKRLIEQAVHAVFQAHNLSENAIAGLATIDTKADEAGLIEFCRDRHLPLHCFSADQLRLIAVPHPSGASLAAVGTPSVAEAAALLASWEVGREREAGGAEEQGSGKEEQQEQKKLPQGEAGKPHLPTPDSPFPIPPSQSPTSTLYVPKQIVRNVGQSGLVTVAIARSLLYEAMEA